MTAYYIHSHRSFLGFTHSQALGLGGVQGQGPGTVIKTQHGCLTKMNAGGGGGHLGAQHGDGAGESMPAAPDVVIICGEQCTTLYE